MKRAFALALALGACTPHTPVHAPYTGMDFIRASMRAWPAGAETALVVQSPESTRVAIYDDALAALVFTRAGMRDEASRVLRGLARLQRPDGAMAFSFELPEAADAPPYLRSGALAWVGFAAVAYLDADRGGEGRDAIARMAHEIARYLLVHQVRRANDPREGLITGGFGTFVYEAAPAEKSGLRERLLPGEIPWASVEHNIDAYFFLRALGRVAEEQAYIDASTRIADALRRGWSDASGQLPRGVNDKGWDPLLALDCASWASMMLAASGERAHAETAFLAADSRYASRDHDIRGHRPYAGRDIYEDPTLMRVLADRLPARDWDHVDAVWPEGSAGVALAAIRLGHRDRAVAIVNALEPLRAPSGGLPTFTVDIPYELDTAPSIAGTAWVEIVRDELAHPEVPPLVWPL